MPIGLQEWIMMIPMIMIPMTSKIEDEDEECNNEEDETEDQLEQYHQIEDQLKQIDTEEIEYIIRDARENTNPKVHVPNSNANEEQPEQPLEQLV